MVKAQDTLAAKFVAGVTAVVMTLSAFAGFAPQAQAQASDINALCAVVASLQAAGNSNATLDALAVTAGCSGDVVVVAGDAGTYLYHPNVDFEFTRNLYIGSRGNDVKMLQMALNASADTRVSVSGPGAPGMETEYFGPATRAAVVKFQVKTGVTPALGYFYPLTRAEMNKRVAGTPVTPTTPSTGNGDLNVMEGDNPEDDLFPRGVVRFVVTAFELEGDDVQVDSITVRYNGDADEDEVIDSVLLLDEDMNVIGDDESLDSDEEATFDVDMEIDGTEMFYVAVNATNDATDFEDNDGLDFTFDVIEVEADGDVDGLPVSGAEMTVQDNIEIGDIDLDVKHEGITIEIGEEDEEFLTLDFKANPDDDESMFIKSIRLENKGNGDLEDLDNIVGEIDNEEFDGEVMGDYIMFDLGNGYELEDGDSQDFEIRADVTGGAQDTFRFVVDETYDVYVENEDGYGVFIDIQTPLDTDEVTIGEGSTRLSDSDEEEGDEISVGDDIVIGYFDFEVEGEDITVDELTFIVDLTNGSVEDRTTGAALTTRLSDFLLEDVEVKDQDGNVVLKAEDAEWTTKPSGAAANNGSVVGVMEIEFSNITFPEGDHEDLMITATIDDNLDTGTTFQIRDLDQTSFSDVEGVDSDETVAIDGTASFEERDIEAAELEFSLEANTPSAADRNTTNDVDEYHMATLDFDATESGEDVEVNSVELTLAFATSADPESNTDNIEDMTNCRLFDEDTNEEIALEDEVDGEENDTEYEFEFEEALVVPADEKIKLELRCDLGDDLAQGETITWSIASVNDVDAEGEVTGNDDIVTLGNTTAATITIAQADVTIASDSDTPDDQVVKFGDRVVLGILEVESDNGEATIDEIQVALTDLTVIDDAELYLYFEGSLEDTVDLDTDTSFENLNIRVEDGENIQLEIRGDASLSNTGSTSLSVIDVTLEDGAVVTGPVVFNDVTVFEGIPVITLISDVTNDNLDTSNDAEIFEIAIEADGEDVTVDQIVLNFDVANTNIQDLRFEVFENASHTNEAGTNNEGRNDGNVISPADEGERVFTFEIEGGAATPITIPDGDTYYFVLMGDPTVTDDTRSIRVTLEDVAGAAKGVSFTAPVGLTDSSVILEDDIEVLHKD